MARMRTRGWRTAVLRICSGTCACARRAGPWLPLLAALLAAGCGGELEQSILEPRSPWAERVAGLWWLMLTLATLVLVAVSGALYYGLFRAAPDADAAGRARSDRVKTRFVAAAFAATVLILVGTFVASLLTGRGAEETEAEPALVVDVVGVRFWWEVRYPDAGVVTANEIHIPVDEPVLVRVWTHDVIHSFWVPNLHGKIDMIPGRINQIRMQASEPGTYRGQCAEFCGIQHAKMAFMVVAEPREQFDAWLARQRRPAPEPTEPLAVLGRQVFREEGCAECHRVRGVSEPEPLLGPDLTHLASRLTLAAGILPNTRGHLGGWIANPQRIKPGNNMPYVPLEAAELRALLHYLGTLE